MTVEAVVAVCDVRMRQVEMRVKMRKMRSMNHLTRCQRKRAVKRTVMSQTGPLKMNLPVTLFYFLLLAS